MGSEYFPLGSGGRSAGACCSRVVCGRSCEFQNLVYRFKVEELLPQFHRDRSTVKDTSSNALVRDMNKCVLCSRCIRACSNVQGMVRTNLVNDALT